jgi:hypothetical protein
MGIPAAFFLFDTFQAEECFPVCIALLLVLSLIVKKSLKTETKW